MKAEKTGRIAALLAAGLLVVGASVYAAPKAIPPLPGINAPDKQPKGCVDCHVEQGGRDFRLIAVLKGLKGGHPDVSKIVKNVPADCLKCHFSSAKAPVLGSMVHRNHFINLVDNDFLASDFGSCLSCHTIDRQSGKIAYKNAPANW